MSRSVYVKGSGSWCTGVRVGCGKARWDGLEVGGRRGPPVAGRQGGVSMGGVCWAWSGVGILVECIVWAMAGASEWGLR